MKKIFIVCVAMLSLAVTTACKSGTPNELNTPDPPRAGYTFEDVEITAAEFDSAAMCAGQWQYIRSDREPIAEDTAIVRDYFAKYGLEFFPEAMDECGFYQFELHSAIEICAGDYCETRFLDDTTNLVGFDVVLGTEAVGCVYLQWGSGDMLNEPEYVYIYPMNLDAKEEGKPFIGKPYIYETTPEWCPTCDRQFWGEGNWFYVEGFNRDNEKVYHKVRPVTIYRE